ncbi:MAG: ABC transporter ATP-binding protein [Pseudanabaenaceae cyanobacterium]
MGNGSDWEVALAQVRLDRIGKRVGTTDILQDVSLTIPDGEFWVIVGPSGCGKSTVLRTIAGLETPTQGDVFLGDRCVTGIPPQQRDVAMVFQNYALYPNLTVAENLGFGLKMRGVPAGKIAERVAQTAQMLGLEPLLNRKPAQLSGGQQQRVALGRAIARQPNVFLLDEPLSNLDAQLRDRARTELKLLHQRLGITSLYVTHDRTEALTLADRLVVMSQGQIQQIGPPEAVYDRPDTLMVAAFLAGATPNLVTVQRDGTDFRLGGQAIPIPPPWLPRLTAVGDRPLVLALRPEALIPGSQLELAVSLVEPLGNETLVRTAPPAAPQEIVYVRWPRHQPLSDRLHVDVQPAGLLLFDPESGQRIAP